ncbi:hypothetical protein GGS26DRAFT_191598 [Hypomontagnella submonticulosa]|nr:hypothetical protein GGS26DRAFT_191598 [Hypomontagnella submonticulosa]
MGTASFATMNLTPPSISVVPTISPPTYKRGRGENSIPILSLKATLSPYAPSPVTIQSWATIFNLGLALKRRNFTAQDISQDPPVDINLEITKGPKRPGFQRKKGSDDEKYYVTLYPAQETAVAEHPLNIVERTKDGIPTFQAGHTYKLALSDEGKNVRTWWWGTTDDILDEVDGPPKDVAGIEGRGNIILLMEPVTFEVVE